MKRTLSLCAAVVVALCLPIIAQDQGVPPRPLQSLEARVAELEAALLPLNITVNCGAGETVAAALAQGAGKTGRLTITLTGVCIEAVTISRDNVLLMGSGPGDGLRAPSPNAVVLTVSGAQRVTVYRLQLEGGRNGVVARNGAVLTCSSCTIEGSIWMGAEAQPGSSVVLTSSTVRNNGFHGVFADGGSVVISGTTIQGNVMAGIYGWKGAQVTVNGSTIERNQNGGVGMHQATVQLDSGTVIAGNSGGVGLFGARASLRQVTIEDNEGDGVRALGGSVVMFAADTAAAPSVIRRNKRNGLWLEDTSVAGGFRVNAQITQNHGYGVLCNPAPAVAQITSGWPIAIFSLNLTHVYDNYGGQIGCPGFMP